jgi:hypothetical protein
MYNLRLERMKNRLALRSLRSLRASANVVHEESSWFLLLEMIKGLESLNFPRNLKLETRNKKQETRNKNSVSPGNLRINLYKSSGWRVLRQILQIISRNYMAAGAGIILCSDVAATDWHLNKSN